MPDVYKEKDDSWRWLLSHYIRRNYTGKGKVEIDDKKYKIIIEDYTLPKPSLQAEYLLEFLGQNIKYPSDMIDININDLASVIGSKDRVGVEYIADYLKLHGLVDYRIPGQGSDFRTFYLTIDGWNEYDIIIKGESKSKIAFMAMIYDNPLLDRVYKDHIKSAVREVGFEIFRLDEIPRAGLIDNHLRSEIRKSKLILADLTFDNNGAYWEAGYAEGLGKPVIYLCNKIHFNKFKTHFDTNHHTTIIWDEDEIDIAMENLKATIKNTFPLEGTQ